MDKIVEKIAALGVPGLVLLTAMSLTGWAGGAAIVAALAMLGGPFGMLGGIALLVIMALVMNALGEYGFEALFCAVVRGLRDTGMTLDEIRRTIAGYPISSSLKMKVYAYLDRLSRPALSLTFTQERRLRFTHTDATGARVVDREAGRAGEVLCAARHDYTLRVTLAWPAPCAFETPVDFDSNGSQRGLLVEVDGSRIAQARVVQADAAGNEIAVGLPAELPPGQYHLMVRGDCL